MRGCPGVHAGEESHPVTATRRVVVSGLFERGAPARPPVSRERRTRVPVFAGCGDWVVRRVRVCACRMYGPVVEAGVSGRG